MSILTYLVILHEFKIDTLGPFDLLHYDVWGLSHTPFSCHCYDIMFTNDYTMWVLYIAYVITLKLSL